MRILSAGLIAISALALILSPHSADSSGQVSIQRTSAGAISLKAENAPLKEVVTELSTKCGLTLNGIPLGNDAINLKLADGSLDDTLRRLLRGYNYVLIRGEGSEKGNLMILSKAERVALTYTPPAPPPAVNAQAATPVPKAQPSLASAAIPMAGPSQPGQAAGAMPEGQNVPAPAADVVGGHSVGPAAGQKSPSPVFGLSPLPQAAGVQAQATTGGATATNLSPPSIPRFAGVEMPPMPPSVPLAPSAPDPTAPTEPEPKPDQELKPIIINPNPRADVPPFTAPPKRPSVDLTPPKIPF